jgi:adenosylcobinamide-phosphate synthase
MPERSRALGLILGYAADSAFGDPRRFHPVAGYGALARRVEDRLYADERPAGVVHALVLVGSTTALGGGLDRLTRDRPTLNTLVVALATWTVLGGRSLTREALLVHGHLVLDDLVAARQQVTHLVGRDPASLDVHGVARATIESVAENTSDAVVAPLVWGALAGPAGLLGYRAANTLDAMIGHRSSQYLRFGWAAARLDDMLNIGPSRLAALLTSAAAPGVGGSSGAALGVWKRYAGRHPSPNAGPVEAAFAGALGVTLGGTNSYGGSVENRGTLGSGPAPEPADIERAARLSCLVGAAALGVALLAATTRRARPCWPVRNCR